jgi:hypothetical protein
MRKVIAEVSPDGKIGLEFVGFAGDECTEERQRLRKILLDLGLMLEPEKITKKSSQQITTETNMVEKEKVKSSPP